MINTKKLLTSRYYSDFDTMTVDMTVDEDDINNAIFDQHLTPTQSQTNKKLQKSTSLVHHDKPAVVVVNGKTNRSATPFYCLNRYRGTVSSSANECSTEIKTKYQAINTLASLTQPQRQESEMLTGPNINTRAVIKSCPVKSEETDTSNKCCNKSNCQVPICEDCGSPLELGKSVSNRGINLLTSRNLINSTLCRMAGRTKCL